MEQLTEEEKRKIGEAVKDGLLDEETAQEFLADKSRATLFLGQAEVAENEPPEYLTQETDNV